MASISKLQKQIDRLAKSTSNVQNARNPAQREAAEKFLVQRAQELDRERKEIEAWLHEADTWINARKPEINADEGHEHNREWTDRLHEYQSLCDALNAAWEALMTSKERAA